MTRPSFRFERASRGDEAEIRVLVASLAMPGTISVRFAREPDYFLGTTIQGDPCDVLVARHVSDGALAGVMVRAERHVYLNGQPARMAYIGQIRVAPRFQGRWLMQQATRALAELHDPALPYMGVIAADNPVALGTIAGRRAPGAPRLARVARLVSPALVLRARRPRTQAFLPVEWGSHANLDEIVAFLRRHGPRRNLFPVVEHEDLLDGTTWRDLRLEDLRLARRDGEIAGVMGSWDQSAFKQEIVAGYAPRLRRLLPAYDLLGRMLGAPPLPRPGVPIRTAFGCLRCLADDDPDVLAALLRSVRERSTRQRQAFLMLGFDERDPQLRQLGHSLRVSYRSDVFVGTFDGSDPAVLLDGRPAYIEIGTL